MYDVKQKAQLELCVPLAIMLLIADIGTRWRCNFEGLSQDGGRAKFAEKLRASPFNEYLSYQTTFNRSISLDTNFQKQKRIL